MSTGGFPADESAGGGSKVDPQHEDPILDRGLGIADHRVVHEIGLSLALEALAIGALDRWQAPCTNRIGPGPEAFHHGLRVELFSHGPIVPGRRCATDEPTSHYTVWHW